MPLPRLRTTLTWPVNLFVTTTSSKPRPIVSARLTSDVPSPTGSEAGARKLGGTN